MTSSNVSRVLISTREPSSAKQPKLAHRADLAQHGRPRDAAAFPLSTTQANIFAAWTRPAQLFGLNPARDKTQDENFMMQLTDCCDLVQDVTTDCSVVASLSAAARVLLGRHTVRSFLPTVQDP